MFSINELLSNLTIVRPNFFYVTLQLPPDIISRASSGITEGSSSANLWDTSIINSSTFKYRCETAELPGRTIATSDESTFGPTKKFAYDQTYNDLTFQIIASEDMRERKVFEYWMEYIVANTNNKPTENRGGLVRYYDSYSQGQVVIHQVNDKGQDLAIYTLYDAYPIQMGSMNLSWAETDTYQRFSVTMSYRYHLSEFPRIPKNKIGTITASTSG